MTAFLGWIIIVLIFGSFSLALLWPGFRLMRRARAGSRGLLWCYVCATAVCGLGLWYVIPLAVHGLFGRATL
jgi:hypothetical protein